MNDFYSDTKTKPSHAMLEYALGRNFGDEQQDEDPTTLELLRMRHLRLRLLQGIPGMRCF